MAVALLLALVNLFLDLPSPVEGLLTLLVNGAFMVLLSDEVRVIPTLAAAFVTAFLGLLIRNLSASDTPSAARRLRRQVPRL